MQLILLPVPTAYCRYMQLHIVFRPTYDLRYVIQQLLYVVCNSDFRIFRIEFLYAVPYLFVKLLKIEGWTIYCQ